MKASADNMTEEFGKFAESGQQVEAREVFGKFSMDTIASCAFGVDAESFTNPNSRFVANAGRIFQNKPVDLLKIAVVFIPFATSLLKLFGFNVVKGKQTRFFVDVVRDTLEERRRTGRKRNDMVDMMVDLMKDPAQAQADAGDEHGGEQFELDSRLAHSSRIKEFDEKTLVSTAMIMMVAGYDTTGITLAHVAYQLAKHPDVQQKLLEEVDEAVGEAGGQLPDYSVIQTLPYLDQVMCETLRMHPPAGLVNRIASRDYTLPGTDLTLPKGATVLVNVSGIHSDPKFYPDPQKFNPDHFSKEARASRSPYTFLPFGQGPRACLGMRLALLEGKVALVSFLTKFRFVKGDKTADKLTFNPTSHLGYPKEGLWVKVERREI